LADIKFIIIGRGLQSAALTYNFGKLIHYVWRGYTVVQLVETLRYEPGGRGVVEIFHWFHSSDRTNGPGNDWDCNI